MSFSQRGSRLSPRAERIGLPLCRLRSRWSKSQVGPHCSCRSKESRCFRQRAESAPAGRPSPKNLGVVRRSLRLRLPTGGARACRGRVRFRAGCTWSVVFRGRRRWRQDTKGNRKGDTAAPGVGAQESRGVSVAAGGDSALHNVAQRCATRSTDGRRAGRTRWLIDEPDRAWRVFANAGWAPSVAEQKARAPCCDLYDVILAASGSSVASQRPVARFGADHAHRRQFPCRPEPEKDDLG